MKGIATTTLGRMRRTAGALWATARAARATARPEADEAALIREAVGRFGELKGIAMKVGQIASYMDVALPEEVRQGLATLQTWSDPMPAEQVRALVAEALGERAAPLLAGLEPAPVAAASIGQVHRATLPDGRRVTIKVRYPHVEDAIRADFGPARMGARMASLFVPGARIDDVIGEARARFLEECDYAHEAAAQQQFRALLAGDPVIHVPEVHGDLSAASVLTTEWVDGDHLTAWLARDPSQLERDRAGMALFGFYLGTLFRHGLYNCDPHPGNYLFRPDGRLTVLDYGCTRAFEPPFVDALAALTRAVHTDDPEALHEAYLDVGLVRDRRYDAASARRLVRAFYGPMLRDEVAPIDLGEALSLAQVTRNKREMLRLSLPGELLFLLRIRFGLMGVIAQLGARANWYRLEEAAIAGRGAAR